VRQARSHRDHGLAAFTLAALLGWPAYAGPAPVGAPATGRVMTVTVDDLPTVCTCRDLPSHQRITEALISTFTKNKIPVIGFVNEGKVYPPGTPVDTANPQMAIPERVALLAAWLDAGFELGNHTFSHPDLNGTPTDQYEREILRGDEVLRDLYASRGGAPRYFRHPYLHTGRDCATKERLETFLHRRGYQIAPVTVDNADWIFARAYDRLLDQNDQTKAGKVMAEYISYMVAKTAFFERQSRDLFGREIPQVLLIHASRLNADGFDELAKRLTGLGYRFEPLEKTLEDPAYRLSDSYLGRAGISWIQRWAKAEGKGKEFFAGEPSAPAWVMELAGVDSE
jgi:peptidoglycan/xylan/chitin deacetylase (PgdA/CDA1 family)